VIYWGKEHTLKGWKRGEGPKRQSKTEKRKDWDYRQDFHAEKKKNYIY